MSYLELPIKRSYKSCGEGNIASSFLVPALKTTKMYRRSVGYFSSSVFLTIMDGIVALARNNGKIQLIASPKLSAEDVDAIQRGYAARENIIQTSFQKLFSEEMESVNDDICLNLLVELISRGTLDIKIAVTETLGDYHDKLGILQDFNGNTIVFFGSANSSLNGYQNNYEKIRIVKSWCSGEEESVADEIEEFNSLWNGTNKYVQVYDFSESAKKSILNIISRRSEIGAAKSEAPITLRDYQQKAIQAWEDNNYHGFYVMATGTGKTWTAIYSAKKLIETKPAMIVICAPYKHLVKQWADDVSKAFPEGKIVLVSSENPSWEQQISQEIIRKKYNPENQLIVISTIASFRMNRFFRVISKSSDEKLLIVDEAHRFTERSDDIKEKFNYFLGLSATPYSGRSAEKGQELMSWFGGQVFSLPIEEALSRGFLVPYNYYPIYVRSTDTEETQFNKFTQKIVSCFRNNKCINPDLLVSSVRNRLRIISMAEEKQWRIREIIGSIKEHDHFVVYCGDGRLFDNQSGEEIRHIQSVKRVLSELEYKASQFTAQEDMQERIQLVDAFNKGEISALAAIRCLDEGINIPSIQSALILSSNDDYREFVQRRGRILRTYPGKEYANIYDVIALPNAEMTAWAKIELRRFLEYARLAKNYDELEPELETQLSYYGLSIEDIDVFDYDEMGESIDE